MVEVCFDKTWYPILPLGTEKLVLDFFYFKYMLLHALYRFSLLGKVRCSKLSLLCTYGITVFVTNTTYFTSTFVVICKQLKY